MKLILKAMITGATLLTLSSCVMFPAKEEDFVKAVNELEVKSYSEVEVKLSVLTYGESNNNGDKNQNQSGRFVFDANENSWVKADESNNITYDLNYELGLNAKDFEDYASDIFNKYKEIESYRIQYNMQIENRVVFYTSPLCVKTKYKNTFTIPAYNYNSAHDYSIEAENDFTYEKAGKLSKLHYLEELTVDSKTTSYTKYDIEFTWID